MTEYTVMTMWGGMIIDKFSIESDEPRHVLYERYEKLAGPSAHVFLYRKYDENAPAKPRGGIINTILKLLRLRRA